MANLRGAEAHILTSVAWVAAPWRAEQTRAPTLASFASVELLRSPLAARLDLTTLTNFTCLPVRPAASDGPCDVGDSPGVWPLAGPVVSRLPKIALAIPRTTTRPITDKMAVQALWRAGQGVRSGAG
jgi:hypothetical protein